MSSKIDAPLVWHSAARAELGECPLWDTASGSLHWIDVVAPAVWQFDGHSERAFPMPRPVASIFFGAPGKLLVAMRQTLCELDLATGANMPHDGVAPPAPEERFNDGRCDARGRIWLSTMDRQLQRGIGSLVTLDGALHTTDVVATSAKLGNGVCFSPDGRWLYFSDTFERAIYRYPLVDGKATASDRTLFSTLDADPGRPDGCNVDADGCLWSARVGGGRIDRYAPDGRLVGYLPVPVSHPTHCCFGGPDHSTLFVTSSRHSPHADAFEGQALAGAVLAFDVGVRGLPEPRVALTREAH